MSMLIKLALLDKALEQSAASDSLLCRTVTGLVAGLLAMRVTMDGRPSMLNPLQAGLRVEQ